LPWQFSLSDEFAILPLLHPKVRFASLTQDDLLKEMRNYVYKGGKKKLTTKRKADAEFRIGFVVVKRKPPAVLVVPKSFSYA
jgi:hypothetical protein